MSTDERQNLRSESLQLIRVNLRFSVTTCSNEAEEEEVEEEETLAGVGAGLDHRNHRTLDIRSDEFRVLFQPDMLD